MEITLAQLEEMGSTGFPGLLGIEFREAGDGFVRARLALEEKHMAPNGNATEGQRVLGTLRVENGIGIVRIEDRLDPAIDDVWSALTDPARLGQWYGEVEGDLRAGGEFRARVFASGWEGAGRITVCEPPRWFATVSREPGRDESRHEVTLTPDGDGTRIVYENLTVPPDLLWAYGVGEQIHVEDLGAHLAGLDRNGDSRWAELEPAYRELAGEVA